MADYAGVLADLRAQRATLQEELNELDTIIQGVERRLSRSATGVVPIGAATVVGPLVPPARGWGALTMPEATKAFFKSRMQIQPVTTRQVVEGLVAGGVASGKNLRGHVYNTLHRLSQDDGPFVHHPDGTWSLREWGLPVGEETPNRDGRLIQ